MLYTLTLVSVIFFRIYLLSKGKKRKKNKQDYIKLKSFGTGKETEQNENSAYWTGGDIESDIFDKGNLANIYKELIQQHQITHITWLNSQQWIWIYIFPKKSYRWLTGTWKRCSISLIIKKKQIKVTVKYHLTPVRMAIMKKTSKYKCWWGCGVRELLCTLGRTVNRCSPYSKQYENSSKN